MKKLYVLALVCIIFVFAAIAFAADIVPDVIMMPGTQPKEVSTFDSPDRCDNCHGGYDSAIYSNEPAFGWRGSAMGNAGRDPIFWATLAIAEQDFDGAGDLCIRCHSAGGWIAGRSTPTDGSGLQAGDDDGIDCDTCHKATNPDNSEHAGVMNPPFVANDGTEGYYGSGILSIWGGSDKLGPYDNVKAKHQWMSSAFHRGDICGSCHDVSNSAVGQLAPNAGTQDTAEPVTRSVEVGYPINPNLSPNDPAILAGMAAFNNPPYAYGIVERTFSEWKASALDDMDVLNFSNLPIDLQAQTGALHMAYESALLAGGTYLTPTMTRTFSCQSCHMRPDVGEGCNKAGTPTRDDLPKHDFAGGNYWVWPLIKYQDAQGTLRLGGGLTQTQLDAIDAGQIRAEDQLKMAASLEVIEDASGIRVKVTNLTGHKLISGYPEGRRMWLNIKWYDSSNNLVKEDGAYGPLGVTIQNPVDGTFFEPQSILDLSGTDTKIYEVHPAITHEWAVTLAAIGHTNTPIGFNRLTGAIEGTIGELGAEGAPLGPYAKSFHFALNNYIADDNRIPPYGMDYETARIRNALPAPDPDIQYGGGSASYNGLSGVYEYWDEVTLSPPTSTLATYAEITLYYQGTSWEYVQFLWRANTLPAGAFLADEGKNYLDAWVKTGMVPPFAMATATWGALPPAQCEITEQPEARCFDSIDNDCDGLIDGEDSDCQQTQIICSDYTTRNLCNAQATCRWDNKNKVCVNQ